jgi:hypothetical protein
MALVSISNRPTATGGSVSTHGIIRLLPILLLPLLAGCDSFVSNFICGNDILQEAVSPDGQFIATVFERDCGATTAFYRIVSLRKAKHSFNSEAKDDWVFHIKYQPKIKLSWTSGDKLSIYYGEGGRQPIMEPAWNEVKISYPD